MKQLLSLFLLLLPCLAWAQYPSNGNQKITLGEQTTADGLIYRGVLADTGIITPLSDTSAYIILDTVNHRFYNYNRATNVWSVAGGGTAVTTFSGGTTGLTPNTATSGAVTLGGTLAVANGGTGSATQNFVDLTNTQTVGGVKTLSNELILNNSLARQININSNNQYGGYILFQKNSSNIGFLGNAAQLLTGSTTEFEFRAQTTLNLTAPTDIKLYSRDVLALSLGASQAATFSSLAGTGSRTVEADVNGVITAPVSSINYKENVQTLDYGLTELLQINPVSFDYINKDKWGDERNLGFIVEDMFPVIPEVTGTMNNGDMYLDMTKLIPVLTKAIQEQQALIKALEQRIINLENK
jgi:hypothetical protein